MLTLNELLAIADKDDVDVTTVERDYVLTHSSSVSAISMKPNS